MANRSTVSGADGKQGRWPDSQKSQQQFSNNGTPLQNLSDFMDFDYEVGAGETGEIYCAEGVLAGRTKLLNK